MKPSEKKFPNTIKLVMEAITHIKKEDAYYFCNHFASLHWKYIGKKKKKEEVPKSVFKLCRHEGIQTQTTKLAEDALSFCGIEEN